jgi:hypothetical protein
MISAHDIALREDKRREIQADTERFLAAGGQVRPAAASDYDHQGIRERLTERTRDGWDNRMSKAREKLTGASK